MKVKENPLLKEEFIFRPLRKYPNMLRYAEGKWVPDDGQPDMAFVYGNGAPIAEYVDLPYYTNILWSWSEIKDGRMVWHYCTTNNDYWYDLHFENRREHPNEVAGRSASDKCCSLYHCANGRGVDIDQDNEYIQNGLLLIKSTMQPVVKPKNPVCFLCLNYEYGHKLNRLEEDKAKWERYVEEAKDSLDKAIKDQHDYKEAITFHSTKVSETEAKIKELIASRG